MGGEERNIINKLRNIINKYKDFFKENLCQKWISLVRSWREILGFEDTLMYSLDYITSPESNFFSNFNLTLLKS